jgi:putative cell wall-binding protein
MAVAVVVAAAAMFVAMGASTVQAVPHVRWSGSTRIATSVAVSQNGFPAGADTVLLATGAGFPDALAAGPLAGRIGAPVLLTDPGALPELVRGELVRLAPSTVILLGGPGAISSNVQAQANAATGVTSIRIAGADRYETAALLAAFGFAAADTVYLATGVDYPDALSAGPAGGVGGGPVLLTRPTSLPPPRPNRSRAWPVLAWWCSEV